MLSSNILLKEYNDWVNEKSAKRYKTQPPNTPLKRPRIILDRFVREYFNQLSYLPGFQDLQIRIEYKLLISILRI